MQSYLDSNQRTRVCEATFYTTKLPQFKSDKGCRFKFRKQNRKKKRENQPVLHIQYFLMSIFIAVRDPANICCLHQKHPKHTKQARINRKAEFTTAVITSVRNAPKSFLLFARLTFVRVAPFSTGLIP